MKKVLKIFSVYCACFCFLGCGSQEAKLVKETRFLMGTLFDITVSHPDIKKAKAAIEKAFGEIKRIEGFASKYIAKSEVAMVNAGAGQNALLISSELYKLLRKSIHYSQITNGAFDITVGVIEDAWNFNNSEETIPSQNILSALLPLVDYKSIILEKNFRVRLKKKGMKLDLGAIAKGYAVDRGLEILKKENINNAIVNGGGDLKCIGEKKRGTPWKVGVRHPRDPSSIVASLETKNLAIATSGDYQKYFIKNGRRYHHLLDPSTGLPARGLQSVTIFSRDAILADAMATAVFVMGADQGLKFIESQGELEGVLISNDGKKMISSGLKGKLEFNENN